MDFYRDISIVWFNNLLNTSNAKEIHFDITMDDLADLMESQEYSCYYSGVSLVFPRLSSNPPNSGKLIMIRKQDGYIVDNLRWVSKDVYLMMCNIGAEKFLEVINLIKEKL